MIVPRHVRVRFGYAHPRLVAIGELDHRLILSWLPFSIVDCFASAPMRVVHIYTLETGVVSC